MSAQQRPPMSKSPDARVAATTSAARAAARAHFPTQSSLPDTSRNDRNDRLAPGAASLGPPPPPRGQPSPAPQTPQRPAATRTPSASNIAAVVAAARFAKSPGPAQPPAPRAPSAGVVRAQAEPETATQELPSPGTVNDVKKWMQSLNEPGATADPTKWPSQTADGQPLPLQTPSTPNRIISLEKSIDKNGTSMTIVSSPVVSPAIHSPKPVRRVTPLTALQHVDKAAAPELSKANTAKPEAAAVGDSTSKVSPPQKIQVQPPSQPHSTLQTGTPLKPSRSAQPPPSSPHMEPLTFTHHRAATISQPPHHDRPRIHTTDVNALADAMVASHLASSRASSRGTSPSKAKDAAGMTAVGGFGPPPRRSTDRPHYNFLSHFSHGNTPGNSDSRTPSPHKGGLRQTMRKEPREDKEDEDDDAADHYKRGRGRAAQVALGIRKHPHKHHEGDRKRWRDRVTEAERKRYEGVWAANRGVCVPVTDAERQTLSVERLRALASDAVGALAVRELWSRSRLPAPVLAEVWDLVDGSASGQGRLSREEFVVGLWLVDQRLKGRKLPIRVSETLWKSVRGVYGLKVPKLKG